MSGLYPNDPCFAAVNFRSNWAGVKSTSISLRTQGRQLGGHRWEFTARYDPMGRTEFQKIDGFLESQNGTDQTFQIEVPVLSESSGSVLGTPAVNGAHVVGDTSVTLAGFTGILPVGDYVKFSGHDKVYKITVSLSGPGDLNIAPPLVRDVGNGEILTYNNVPFTVRKSANLTEYDIRPGILFQFEVDLIEDV